MPDWYRCTDWNAQSEAEFFRRLKRARRQKPQYLVIQAGTLVGTGRPEVGAAALNLIERFVQEHYEEFFASSEVGLGSATDKTREQPAANRRMRNVSAPSSR